MNDTSLFRPWLECFAELSPTIAILAKVTLLLAAAWGIHGLLSKTNPRWRVLTWRFAVVGLLLIPLCHVAAPAIEFQVPGLPIADRVEVFDLADLPVSRLVTDVEAAGTFQRPTVDHFMPHGPFDADLESSGGSWPFFAFATWCSGFLFCLFRMAIGLLRIRLLLSRSQAAPASIEADFARVADGFSLNATCQVRVSADVPSPILCGLFHPTLLIPATMAQASRRPQLPAVFSHELAHVQSRDLVWNLFLHVMTSVLWFHPLAWLVRATQAAACESVSDAVASTYIGDVQLYARTLAQIALEAVSPPTLSLGMARTSDVQMRVRALERRVFSDGLTQRSAGVAIACCVLIVVVLGSVKGDAVAAEPMQPVAIQTAKATDEPSKAKNDGKVAPASPQPPAALLTAGTVAAVGKALRFLASRQRADGSFNGGKAGANVPAVTALCGMAFLASGSKPGEGTYGDEIQKAREFLLTNVQDNGFIGSGGSMYVHAYALRFLAEAQLAVKDPRTEEVITKAVKLVVESQNDRDGWRYFPGAKDADTSATSCQLIALQMAIRAGASVPDETIERAVKYLQSCQTLDGGFAYVQPIKNNSALPRSAAVMAALYLSVVDR